MPQSFRNNFLTDLCQSLLNGPSHSQTLNKRTIPIGQQPLKTCPLLRPLKFSVRNLSLSLLVCLYFKTTSFLRSGVLRFWEVLKKWGCTKIRGVDAHSPFFYMEVSPGTSISSRLSFVPRVQRKFSPIQSRRQHIPVSWECLHCICHHLTLSAQSTFTFLADFCATAKP